jgi:hypothetical protein
MGNVSMQMQRAVSPLLTGILFTADDLALLFFIGAAFQADVGPRRIADGHCSICQITRPPAMQPCGVTTPGSERRHPWPSGTRPATTGA